MDIKHLRHAAERHRHAIMQPYDAMWGLDGFDAICTFADLMEGRTIYVPRKGIIFAGCIALQARQEYFAGSTIAELAKKYGYSERHIRRLVNLRE